MRVQLACTERVADDLSNLEDPVYGCASISLDIFECALNQVKMASGEWARCSLGWKKDILANSDVDKLRLRLSYYRVPIWILHYTSND